MCELACVLLHVSLPFVVKDIKKQLNGSVNFLKIVSRVSVYLKHPYRLVLIYFEKI